MIIIAYLCRYIEKINAVLLKYDIALIFVIRSCPIINILDISSWVDRLAFKNLNLAT